MADSDTLPADPTLAEIRSFLAPHIAQEAAFDGWGKEAVVNAARAHQVDQDLAILAFNGDGKRIDAMDLIDAWIESIDAEMARRLPADALAKMKIRERIRQLVECRIDLLSQNRESLRRALAIEAMPLNAPRALQWGWRSADVMWRLAGDTATDYNHYTKRAMLGSIYAATLAVLINDDSENQAETRAFVGRRIDNVMSFEKAKFQFLQRTEHLPSLSRFIGRLRYPGV